EAILKLAACPLETLPLSVVLHNLVHHGVALAIALPLMLAFWGAKVSVNLVWVLIVLALFACFTLALALWLSAVGLFFLDARDILDVGFPILFWATPIFYSTDMAPGFVRPLLHVNPLTSFINAVQAPLLDGRWPHAADLAWMTGWTAAARI